MGALPSLRPPAKGVNVNCLFARPRKCAAGPPPKGDGPAQVRRISASDQCVGSVLAPAGAARVREAGAVVVVVVARPAGEAVVVTRAAREAVPREVRTVPAHPQRPRATVEA